MLEKAWLYLKKHYNKLSKKEKFVLGVALFNLVKGFKKDKSKGANNESSNLK